MSSSNDDSSSTPLTLTLTRIWLILSNAVMMLGWANVLFFTPIFRTDTGCDLSLTPRVRLALGLSLLELVNAVTKCTRSKPHHVLLFAVIRLGVEVLVTPAVGCVSWQHLATVLCWSVGDTVRFGCFCCDHIMSSSTTLPKRIRYTVGPFLFPFGALGEMLMVVQAGRGRTPPSSYAGYAIYGAAALWPLGFYPLYTQLLRQRNKYFASLLVHKEKDA